MVRLAFDINEDSAEFETLKRRFLDIYSANIARHTVLFDGMEEVLDTLESKRCPWGVVTNKSSWLTGPLMHALKLAKRTPCIVCGDTTSYPKPNPAPMLHACELLQCAAEETIYVGDAKRDIEAGNRAAMTTVIASYGYIDEKDELESWGANGTVNTPLEILDWLA